MSDVVIVAYRPKPGCEAALLALTKDHVPHLRSLGLATDRPSTILQAKDGVIIEVFEWVEAGMTTAHENPEVLKMWSRYAAVSDYLPLSALPEASELFAAFKPIENR